MNAASEGAAAVSIVAAAYDAIAPVYDVHLRHDEALRHQLWRHYATLFRPGMRVLDAGCGTGIDALFLARNGVHVEAIDISPGMLAQLEGKVRAASLTRMVTARLLAVGELATLPPASFDGIICAYAVLNTVPDLPAFSIDAARLLRPGGRLLVHMLNPPSTWGPSVHWLRRSGSPSATGATPGERLVPIGGQAVPHALWNADETYRRFFGRHFHLVRAYGMGAWAPQIRRRLPPGLSTLLGGLERRVAGWRCWRRWGRFFLLELALR